MAGSRARIGGALLLACLLAQATPSLADKAVAPVRPASDPSPSPSPSPSLAPKLELDGPEAEAKDRARLLFQQGVTAYRAGKYYEAVEIFLDTQRIYPDTQLCFNVARAYENLGNSAAALRYYRDYLRQADRPSDGDDVRERVRRLEQQLAQRSLQQVTVLSRPESATVLLDGKPVGITPWTGETYPGQHRLALTLDNYAGQEQVIDVDAYAAHDVSVVLMPLPKPQPTPPAISIKENPAGVSLGTIITLSTGLVLLGSAIAAEAVNNQPGMSRSATFLAGSGLGVSGTGGVMLYFDLSPHSRNASLPLREKDSALVRQ